MAGLDPAIQELQMLAFQQVLWIAGSGPAME